MTTDSLAIPSSVTITSSMIFASSVTTTTTVHVIFRLGQACSHIAVLLFYIENHAHDDELPTDKSKTSKAMTWNQPPKKSVTPACASFMTFVKPSHGDDSEQRLQQIIKRSAFDLRQPQHRTEKMDEVNKLLESVEKSIPSTGLQQFWRSKTSDESVGIEYSDMEPCNILSCYYILYCTTKVFYSDTC